MAGRLFERVERMTREEEVRVGEAAHRGSLCSQDELVRRNLAFAVRLAHAASTGSRAYLRDDLEQEASMGMMEAARRYDPALGTFVSYAAWWVKAYIARALEKRESGSVVKGSERRGTGVCRDKRARVRDASLDAPLEEGGCASGVAWEGRGPEEEAGAREGVALIRSTLEQMRSVRGLGQAARAMEGRLQVREPTLEEVGQWMGGLSRERVRQLEARAVEVLRDVLTDGNGRASRALRRRSDGSCARKGAP